GERFLLQAEDGIRDRNVTGVQTCALPIFARSGVVACSTLSSGNQAYPPAAGSGARRLAVSTAGRSASPKESRSRSFAPNPCIRITSGRRATASANSPRERSEERRVGKEWGAVPTQFHTN